LCRMVPGFAEVPNVVDKAGVEVVHTDITAG
jgi:hypothetical protein